MFLKDKENQKIKQDKEYVSKDVASKQVEVKILNKATKKAEALPIKSQ